MKAGDIRGNRYVLSLYDTAILLYNFGEALNDPSLHLEDDAEFRPEDMIKYLNHLHTYVEKERLESIIYASKLRHGQGKFWHPQDMDFASFTQKLVSVRNYYDLKRGLILPRRRK